jgi:uroporphyrin-3 C-methyltransferase
VAERLRALGAHRIVTTPADDDALVSGLQTWSSDNTMSDIQSAAPVPSDDSVQASSARRLASPANAALLVSLLALGLTGWQYYQTRHMLNQARAQMAQRLAESGGASRELRGLTEQALNASRANEAKLARLEDQINVAAGQYATLNGMYQELTKSRADWLLAEVEHTVTVASQQLQLTGNVPAATEALQGASDRLAQFDKPQLIGVKRALAADLEALKNLPPVDTVGLTVKLDRLALEVDRLPLVIDQHRLAAQLTPHHDSPNTPWWQRLVHEVTQSLGELVRIRRMDKPEALLLSPEQALFLRENLKLRLADARLALLQRDSAALHADIDTARGYVQRYFDRDAAATQDWLRELAAFDKVPLDTRLPDLARSLRAVHDAQGG